MRDEYDFSGGRRGAIIPSPGQAQVTLMLDQDLVERLRARAEAAGTGYQAFVNQVLRNALERIEGQDDDKPVTATTLRRILREELPHAAVSDRS